MQFWTVSMTTGPEQFRKYSNIFQSDIPIGLNRMTFRPTTSRYFSDGLNKWTVMSRAAWIGATRPLPQTSGAYSVDYGIFICQL